MFQIYFLLLVSSIHAPPHLLLLYTSTVLVNLSLLMLFLLLGNPFFKHSPFFTQTSYSFFKIQMTCQILSLIFLFYWVYWLTLVNKIIQFQVHNSTHNLYHPKSVYIHHHLFSIYPFRPPFPLFPGNHHIIVHEVSPRPSLFCLIPSPPLQTMPSVPVSMFSIYESVTILLVTSFCSLNSIHQWNHMIFFLSIP